MMIHLMIVLHVWSVAYDERGWTDKLIIRVGNRYAQ